MHTNTKTAVFSVLALLGVTGVAQAGSVTVLDLHRGSYVGHVQYRTPRIVNETGNPVPLLESRRRVLKEEDRKPIKDVSTAVAPAGWSGAAFDASGWPRIRGVLASGISRPNAHVNQTWRATAINRLCARGAFLVADPAAVGSLKLDLVYIGGCVVRLNGEEIARGHLPAGKLDADALAEAYPREAYLAPNGKFHEWGGGTGQLNFHDTDLYNAQLIGSTLGKVRFRTLKGVEVPGRLLRKGLNVLAVEVRTAPVRDLLVGSGTSKWPHAGLYEARLTAARPAGIEPNMGPRPGLAIQNVQVIEPSAPWDYAHPASGRRPIRIVGARNGVFSGKVLVSSAAAIRGLKASVADLKREGGGSIPASATSVRFAVSGDGMLLESVPEKIETAQSWANRVAGKAPPTASARIWISIHVPSDAKAGLYRGKLAVGAGSGNALEVPVELEVADWRVPDPKDWALQHHIYQSPESVAHYYKVPLWSDRHFELIGKSFEVLHQVGNKVLPMNLIADNYTWGNREGMVRWVKDGKDKYTYDFSIVDKYMDVYKARCGDPGTVYLSIWSHANWPTKEMPRKKVTVVDPGTGEVSSMDQPPLGTRENEEFWRPVMTELRKRLEKRGWFKQTAVAYTSYTHAPSKEMVDVYRRIWPDGKWFNCSHSGPKIYQGTQAGMPVSRCEWVWGCGVLYNPDAKEGYAHGAYPRPWKRLGWISLSNPRIGTGLIFNFDARRPPTAYRFISEACIQGDVNGLGRLGADFWPCIPDPRGRLRTMDNAEFGLGFQNAVQAMLSPGKDGAVFNEKLEMFREGVQIAEAIVQVQRGLESGRLGAELAGRIEKLLDKRARCYLHTRDAEVSYLPCWSLESSSWQDRDRRLLALAGEVAKALGAK